MKTGIPSIDAILDQLAPVQPQPSVLSTQLQARPGDLPLPTPQFGPAMPPTPMGPTSEAPPAAPARSSFKETLGNTLSDFMFSLGEGLKHRGKGGQTTGAGAALQAPMLLAMQRQEQAQALQQANAKAAMEQARLQVDQQRVQQEQQRIRQDQERIGNDTRNVTDQIRERNEVVPVKPPDRTPEEEFIALKLQEAAVKAGKPLSIGEQIVTRTQAKNEWAEQSRQTPNPPNLQKTDIEDPADKSQPLQANYNPATGQTTHPSTGEVIKNPKGYRVPPSNIEPGQYLPLTDENGRVTSWVNAKTRQVVTADSLGVGGSFKGPVSAERLKQQNNAKSGLRAVAKLREEIAKPGTLAALAVPGSPTARIARAARKEMIDVLTRIRTGAALNKSEEIFYDDQAPGLIDALFADSETIEYKLSIFEDSFRGLTGDKAGAPPSAPAGGWSVKVKPK